MKSWLIKQWMFNRASIVIQLGCVKFMTPIIFLWTVDTLHSPPGSQSSVFVSSEQYFLRENVWGLARASLVVTWSLCQQQTMLPVLPGLCFLISGLRGLKTNRNGKNIRCEGSENLHFICSPVEPRGSPQSFWALVSSSTKRRHWMTD